MQMMMKSKSTYWKYFMRSRKNPSGTDGCSCRRLYCSSIYAVFNDTDLQLHIQYPCTSKETTLTSLADLQLGASLTSDYTVLITSTPVMEQVISDLDLDMTAEQLKGSVSINNPTDTRILEITVNNTDSKMAKKIVDEIANVSSSYIGDKMEVIPPKIIEVGKIATVRTSPSVKKNAALGFLLGFLACAAIVVVYAVMDDTIKTEEDIEKYLGVSVLAKVPDRKDFINSKNRKSKNKNKKHH